MSLDLALMLKGSICPVAFDHVDVDQRHGDKTNGSGGSAEFGHIKSVDPRRRRFQDGDCDPAL